MNYRKHYNLLMERARNRLLEGYTEKHHIIPRCMGGSDEPDNLVNLTAEEHYVAHQLLCKIYPNNELLVYAANMMTVGRPSNKKYGWLKRKWAKVHGKNQSKVLSGRKLTKEHKEAISEARTGYRVPDKTRQKISKYMIGRRQGQNNPMHGKSAVKGRKWYNNGTTRYYLFPSDPQIAEEGLVPGRLLGAKWFNDGEKEYLLIEDIKNTAGLETGRLKR